MWSFRPLAADALRAFLARQEGEPFSYAEVGASRDNASAPSGYNIDHNRVRLGQGGAAYAAACAALKAWVMFPAPWTTILPVAAPIHEGVVVAMQARAFGVWWLNACRIVYVIDETAPVQRFGFAYGTLLAHAERGEERFSVELHADGAVWYDLRALSQPRYWPARLAKPLARRLQRRFVRDSQTAMQRAVTEGVTA